MVLNKFIEQYGDKLEVQENQKIKDYLKAEDFRYSGHWLKIIFSKIGLKDKLRFILSQIVLCII